jgi:hypothetical protein
MHPEDGRSYDKASGLIQLLSRPGAAIACALLIGLFYLTTIREGHAWGDDFSLYIRHAHNIVHGEPYVATGYIYNPSNPEIGPKLYPPGFPLLLAPVIGLFGSNLRPMKILVIAFFTAALLVMLSLFRDPLSRSYLTALVLIVGLNPFFWQFKDHVLSDIPFLFFVLSSLALFARADAADGTAGRRATLAVLSGLAAYAAYATRTLGVTLIPCFVIYGLCRYRRIRTNATLAAAVALALATFQHMVWFRDASYFDQIVNPVTVALHNVPTYLRVSSDLWENGYSGLVRKVAFLVGGALAAFGYVMSLRTGLRLFHVFPPVYVVPVILWPADEGMRFLIPVVPFYFCYALLGVRRIDAAVERRWKWKRKDAVLVVFLAAVLVSYAARYSTLQFGPLREGIATQESRQLFDFITASTGPNDVLVFSRPRALALMTGRRVSAAYHPADSCGLWQYMRDIGASYIITGPPFEPVDEDVLYLREFVAKFADALQPVMVNRDLAVYRIRRDPCQQANARRYSALGTRPAALIGMSRFATDDGRRPTSIHVRP